MARSAPALVAVFVLVPALLLAIAAAQGPPLPPTNPSDGIDFSLPLVPCVCAAAVGRLAASDSWISRFLQRPPCTPCSGSGAWRATLRQRTSNLMAATLPEAARRTRGRRRRAPSVDAGSCAAIAVR